MTLLKTLINKVAPQESELEIENYPILPDKFFSNYLNASDRTPQMGRAGTYNKHVHVSSLAYDFCPRQYAIAIKEKLPLYESITGGHKVTFALGRAAEHHVREAFIGQYGKDNIYAKWVCRCGKKYRQGLYRDATCTCGKALDRFDEPDIKDDYYGVKGHPDLIFRYQKKLFVVEIKSMKKDQWDELTEPLDAHIKQALTYPYLLKNETDDVAPTVVYIYVTKDFKFGSPYKEFHINAYEPQYIKMRQELLDEARQVKLYVEEGKTPDRICKSIASPLAKKCPVAFRCFNVYKDEVK